MVRYFPEDWIEFQAELAKLEQELVDLTSRTPIEKIVLKRRIAKLQADIGQLQAKCRIAEDDVKSDPRAYQVYSERKEHLRKEYEKQRGSNSGKGSTDGWEP